MWRTEGNFEVEQHPWGDIKSIKYIYNQSGVDSKITTILLDAGRNFFRITLQCASLAERTHLSLRLKKADLNYSVGVFATVDLFLISPEISVLMELMNVVEEIESKVGVLKNKIEQHCKSGFVATTGLPPAKVVCAKEIPKAGATVLSENPDTQSKPYFADLQAQLPGRRRSSLVKS